MSNRLEILSSQLSCPGRQEVFVVGAKRTPIGTYMGKLSHLTGPQLAGICINGALKELELPPQEIEEAIFGNVLSAGIGQAPARQAAILGGLPIETTCTTVNKVCSSGLKALVFGTQSIQLGHSSATIVGGFESMSQAPHMVMNARKGVGHGNKAFIDCVAHDGLTDAFKHISMGICAEKTAKEMKITREMQDEFCKLSYARHMEAVKNKYLKNEIIPVEINEKGTKQIIDKDQEIFKYKEESISKLKPAFEKNGTITSANASKINDGACCLILMSKEKVEKNKLKPLVKIIAYADAEGESVDFCKIPYTATIKVLKKAGLEVKDIDYFEFNEAFSVVPIAMMQMLGVNSEKINVMGGAVAMGHPIGMSGARIVQSLITTLKIKGGKYGLAGICNGGGGSTAVIIENII